MKLNDILILFERRKNDTPKESAYEQLKKYKDDPSIHISFTVIDKIGINPRSKFHTPLGIYAYPLQTIWKKFDHTIGLIRVPFAEANPYIWVLRADDTLQSIVDYTPEDANRDTAKVIDIVKHELPNMDTQIAAARKSAKMWLQSDTPFQAFWNISRGLSVLYGKNDMIKWNYLLRKVGYIGFIDPGTSIIHPSEPIQTVFLTKTAFKTIDRILNSPTKTLNKDGRETTRDRVLTGRNLHKMDYRTFLRNMPPLYVFDYMAALLKHNIKLPNDARTKLEDIIASDARSSYKYERVLVQYDRDVPNNIVKGISADAAYSYSYAMSLIENNTIVPNFIIKSLASSFMYSYEYAEFLVNRGLDVPDSIVQKIANSADYSEQYVHILKNNNLPIPDIIQKAIA